MEFGGYLEAERSFKNHYYEDAIALNSGRNCLRYVIRAQHPKAIALPRWICDSVQQVCKEEHIDVIYYNIDDTLKPILPEQVNDSVIIYVVNYFGQLSRSYLDLISRRFTNLIIDNAQAFFEHPIAGVDTLYTPRKYFGVPDGGLLFTTKNIAAPLEMDCSRDRLNHLYGRLETDAQSFFSSFRQNEEVIGRLPLREMSITTSNMLRNIDYETVKARREENYDALHHSLAAINELNIITPVGPFMYPLLLDNGNRIRSHLIKEGIYVPTLWPNVLTQCEKEEMPYSLTANLLPLPCDQRYTPKDMKKIASSVIRLIRADK